MWGWFFLTPCECSLGARGSGDLTTLSNKVRFYLRTAERLRLDHRKYYSTLQRMWGGMKMEDNGVLKNLPDPSPYSLK